MRVAEVFDIKVARTKEIVDRVLDAVGGWERLAKEEGVESRFRKEMAERLEREGELLMSASRHQSP